MLEAAPNVTESPPVRGGAVMPGWSTEPLVSRMIVASLPGSGGSSGLVTVARYWRRVVPVGAGASCIVITYRSPPSSKLHVRPLDPVIVGPTCLVSLSPLGENHGVLRSGPRMKLG